MKLPLLRVLQILTFFFIVQLAFSNTVLAQSCGNNDIGFNSNSATNNLTICSGTANTTINGGTPVGATYQWEVSSSASGPFSVVSPDPGTVSDWTVSARYCNIAGRYYFRLR
jgi:hypothetical protein